MNDLILRALTAEKQSREALLGYHQQLFLFVEQLDQLEVCLPNWNTNVASIPKFKVEFK